jgi:hypothetical protein
VRRADEPHCDAFAHDVLRASPRPQFHRLIRNRFHCRRHAHASVFCLELSSALDEEEHVPHHRRAMHAGRSAGKTTRASLPDLRGLVVARIRIALVRHELAAWHSACPLGDRRRRRTTHGSDREDVMKKEPRGKLAPRIGRKDLQDPDRDVRNSRDGRVDRGAGAGRPVQLDEEGRSRRPETDSPRCHSPSAPAASATVAKRLSPQSTHQTSRRKHSCGTQR